MEISVRALGRIFLICAAGTIISQFSLIGDVKAEECLNLLKEARAEANDAKRRQKMDANDWVLVRR